MFKGLKLQHSLFGTVCQRWKTSLRVLSDPLRGCISLSTAHLGGGQVVWAAAAWHKHPQRNRDVPATPQAEVLGFNWCFYSTCYCKLNHKVIKQQ